MWTFLTTVFPLWTKILRKLDSSGTKLLALVNQNNSPVTLSWLRDFHCNASKFASAYWWREGVLNPRAGLDCCVMKRTAQACRRVYFMQQQERLRQGVKSVGCFILTLRMSLLPLAPRKMNAICAKLERKTMVAWTELYMQHNRGNVTWLIWSSFLY